MAIKRPIVFLFILLLPACSRPPSTQIEFVLGTMCTVSLHKGGDRQAYARIFARLREIDQTMTAHPGEIDKLVSQGLLPIEGSLGSVASGIIAINRQAGVRPVKTKEDIIDLLEQSLHYAELSGGAFDPTVGPLVNLWGIGSESARIPGGDEIAAALELINWRDVEINRAEGTVFLPRKGMALDLGAIAKGYAGDEARRVARESKVESAVFNLGGNIVTLGGRENGSGRSRESLPWRIGIQNPLSGRGFHIGVVPVRGMSVVTSGGYERFFEEGGKRYHHLLSTTDGYPVENGLLSVTIVTESSTVADALSTSVFCMGYERGRALVDSMPEVEAIFVFADRRVKISGGLVGVFSFSDEEFRLE